MTYTTCKKVIENQKLRNTLDAVDMTSKLDVFLLANRISIEEYNELIRLINEE